MDSLQAIIFGAVQGITEFLPISSTAHLILLPRFMGWTDPGLTFDVALHLGTLVALLVYFRNEWIQLTMSGLDLARGRQLTNDSRMVLMIIAATIPGALGGLFLEDFIENNLRDTRVIAATLITLALVLVVAERVGRRKKSIEELSFADALTVGFAQALALVPGVSRSGVTITAGLFRGLRREAAARFSFFLSTPIIAGAVGKQLLDLAQTGITVDQMWPLVVGILSAGAVGYASIAFLLKFLATNSTYVFVYYRIALGIVVYLAFAS
jgi:undecaprenyl-diphosphatase